jgi:hypothetical protein
MLLLVIPALSQTTPNQSISSSSLRQKYGNPTSETFPVRPSVIAVVSYDGVGKIQEIVIKPKPDDEKVKTIDDKTLEPILDELIPKKERGKYLKGTFFNIICFPANDCGGTGEDYENVYIFRNGNSNAYPFVTITWKNK